MPDLTFGLSRGMERLLRLPNHVLAHTVFDLEVTGKGHIPPSGPVVIAANHASHLDVPLLATNLDRYIRFLAVDELYGNSMAFDAFLEFFDAIPLDRDGYPVRAMRTSIGHLHDRGIIGLFPEGRRSEAWGRESPKRGAAWLAWQSGAPLIPVAIHGTRDSLGLDNRGFKRTSVRIWIEPPLWWHAYADRVDPLGSMMDDWFSAVDRRLAPWSGSGG